MVKENGKLIRWQRLSGRNNDWWLFLFHLDLGIRVTKLNDGYYRIEFPGGSVYNFEGSLKNAKAHAEADLENGLSSVEVTSG